MTVRVRVEGLLGEQDRKGRHGLMRAVVHADRHLAVATLRVRDVLVRRPDVARLQPADHAQHQQRREADDDHAGELVPQEEEQHADRDDDPHQRSCVGERQRRERDDPTDAPEDVEPVGVERGERREQPPDPLGDHGHHHDDAEEDHGQGQPFREGVHGAEPQELGDAVDGAADPHREEQQEQQHARQQQRRPSQRVAIPAGAEEPEADPEEARQQHEVREERQVDVGRGRPADQRQLDEEHEEARHEQRRARPTHVRCHPFDVHAGRKSIRRRTAIARKSATAASDAAAAAPSRG